jgi:hypothetical protein
MLRAVLAVAVAALIFPAKSEGKMCGTAIDYETTETLYISTHGGSNCRTAMAVADDALWAAYKQPALMDRKGRLFRGWLCISGNGLTL